MQTIFSSTIENAIRLANYWHKGQHGKGEECDYFTHPVAVATMLSRSGFDEVVIAAGYCHDLLEYTKCPKEEIITACGETVLTIVETLTEDLKLNANKYWEARKKKYIEAVRLGPWQAKVICVADRIHHLQTLMAAVREYGLDYFQGFYRGPEDKLWFEDHIGMMLAETLNHPLVEEYDALLDQFVEVLEELDKSPIAIPRELLATLQVGDFDEPEIDPVPEESQDIAEPPTLHERFELPINPVEYGRKSISFDEEVTSSKRQPKKKSRSTKNQVEVEPEGEEVALARYLNDDEVKLLLPAALKLGIKKGELTNPFLQEQLAVNFLVAFRILKELKRLHVINRADSFKPRKVDVGQAKAILEQIRYNLA